MILIKVADYVTELMSFDETKVLIGRENATKETFSQDYIVIDNISPATVVANNRAYDYDTEKEDLNSNLSSRVTLEFYGDNAYTNIYKYVNLLNSQQGRDLQKAYDVTFYKPSAINDLKQVVGNKYFDRYEIEIMIQYNENILIDTLRIEEIPVEYSRN